VWLNCRSGNRDSMVNIDIVYLRNLKHEDHNVVLLLLLLLHDSTLPTSRNERG